MQLVSLRLTSAMTLVLIPMKPRRSQGSERSLAVGGGGGDLLGVAMPGTGGSAGWGGGLRQKSELAGLAAVFWGPGWPLPTGPQHGASGQLLLPRLLPGRGLGEGGPKPRAGDSETHTFPAPAPFPLQGAPDPEPAASATSAKAPRAPGRTLRWAGDLGPAGCPLTACCLIPWVGLGVRPRLSGLGVRSLPSWSRSPRGLGH